LPEELPTVQLLDEDDKAVARIVLYPELDGTGPYAVDPGEASENAEAEIQVLEGAAYEYRLDSADYALVELPGVVRRNKFTGTSDQGRITPGLNTGRLRLNAVSKSDPTSAGFADIEVRPAKVGYRTDYRQMLELIAVRCTDLLLELRSPADQSVLPDDTREPETICQRFAFVRSLVTSRKFRDAVQRITALPHRLWEQEESVVPLNRGVRPTASIARQIASGRPRFPLPGEHPLSARFPSLPQRVTVLRNTETVDTAENRFIKHALATFQAFAARVREDLAEIGRASDARFIDEARTLEDELAEVLSRDFFRGISEPRLVPLGSPVLQRKGGYREVLAAWLQFDMAARLCWSGGDDVYGAGKRDVATLYEYWLFFRLLEVLAEVFDLDQPASASLIEKTKDGFGLKLKSGKHLALSSTYTAGGGRKLRVKFSYNRTFSRKGGDEDKNFPVAGSWTERMRPDYTITLWPDGFTEEDAEKQEVIVHVHFDAKYRVENITDMFGKTDESFASDEVLEEDAAEEKNCQREGHYKRADLLKMHTYKDAIRRTAGAYVLYPGTKSKNWRGFHEIVPGLGAFGIRPTEDNDDGTEDIKAFIQEIVKHVCDRATRREQETYHRYRIQDPASPGPLAVREAIAEYDAEGLRSQPPQEAIVLVAWYIDEMQLRWSEENGLIVLRITKRRGSVPLSPENVAAHYVMLHSKKSHAAPGLFSVCTDGNGKRLAPEVVSGDTLTMKYKYPHTTRSDYYLVYHVERALCFDGFRWDIGALLKLKGKTGRGAALPFSATLDEVLNCKLQGSGDDKRNAKDAQQGAAPVRHSATLHSGR